MISNFFIDFQPFISYLFYDALHFFSFAFVILLICINAVP